MACPTTWQVCTTVAPSINSTQGKKAVDGSSGETAGLRTTEDKGMERGLTDAK